MDGPGDHFLADAGLAFDKHRGVIAFGYFIGKLDGGLDGRTFADDIADIELLEVILAQFLHFFFEFQVFQGFFDNYFQFFDFQRFH